MSILSMARQCLLFIALALLFRSAPVWGQPTGNVLLRVYGIRIGAIAGTAFLIDYENRQYLVTARHIVANTEAKADVELLGPGYTTWEKFPVTIVKGKDACADVAILVPVEPRLSEAAPIPYPYHYAFGQEVYFLGFPYGLYSSFGTQGGMGVALIKHAYVSANVSCAAIVPGGSKDETFILLDGMNNPGFSGGPVVAPDMFSPFTNIRTQKLIAVISGFRNENIPIQVQGKAVSNVSVATNSGIIIAVPIETAIELIKEYLARPK